jgi:hypothetical protein
MGEQEGKQPQSPAPAKLALEASEALTVALEPLTALGDLAAAVPAAKVDDAAVKLLKERKLRVRLLAEEVRDVRRRIKGLADDLDAAS